jgi:hypothetical protein
MQTITLPKRTREGSFTPEEVQEALDTLAALGDTREAVVVGTGFESENSARNRARLLAEALQEADGRLFSAHAVKSPATTDDEADTWIGAVSVRANQNPREASTDRPEGAPSQRTLQALARDYEIKGRSKLDYDGLWDALVALDVDPMDYGKSTDDDA